MSKPKDENLPFKRGSAAKKKGRKFLTTREYRFLKGKVKNLKEGTAKSDRQIARESGYSPKTANITKIKQNIIDITSNNKILCDVMERSGLGINSLAQDMASFRDAEDKDGNPAWNIRLQNAQWRGRILDVEAPKRVNVNHNQRRIHIDITEETLNRIRESIPAEEFSALVGKEDE